MGERIVKFAPELLVSLCRGTYRVVKNPAPEGAVIREVYIDGRQGIAWFGVVVHHPDLPEGDDALVPVIEAVEPSEAPGEAG